jgi:hypothetical protein
MKCEYCLNNSVTIFNNELLCEKHYYNFYNEKIEINQLQEVYKIKEEIALNKKYTEFMNNFDFYNLSNSNQNKLKKVLKDFNKSVKIIKIKNKLYKQI